MRDKQVITCLSNLDCVNIGGIISIPHPISTMRLNAVLESSVHPKYYLSPKACRGILRRAEKRGKKLPSHLEQTLRTVAIRETGE